jgi:hypothetical protein
MARGNPKPTEKTNWIPDDTTNIVPPSAGRKLVGWLFNIKPPAEIFNWFWNLKSRFEDYFAAQVEDWIVIDSDADEGDYATLAAYIADAPAAGNRILVKEDQTVAAQVVLPANVTLKFLDGSRLLCATNIATSVLKLGSNPVIEGVLNIVLSHTGTTGKAVEIDGDNATGKINVENSSTGTLTTGYHINANKTGNQITGFIDNTGGGVLTNDIIDNSTEDSNRIVIVDAVNNQIRRSRGSYKFREGLEFDLGSDADGDIYYRDAGILKRLAKGANDTYLRLVAGIPSWSDTFVGIINTSNAVIASGGIQTDGSNTLKIKVIDIGDWDMDATGSINVAHGLGASFSNIRSVSVMIRNDSGSQIYPFNAGVNLTDTTPQGTIAQISNPNINLARLGTGIFNSTDFDATSYNRGWITITYIA